MGKTDMTRHVDSVHLKKPVWQNIRKHYPGGKKPVVEKACEFCGATFSHTILLKKHLSANHRGLQIKFACKKCSKTFTTKFSWNLHMEKNHEDDSYQCKECQTNFTLGFGSKSKGRWSATGGQLNEKDTRAKSILCYENQKCYSCQDYGTPSQRFNAE